MKRTTYMLVASLALMLTSCSDERSPVDPAEDAVRLAQSEGTSITVVGTGNPAVDVPAVQSAVDNYDTVILSGELDFGWDWTIGGIEITRPGVTLRGPAIIRGLGKYSEVPELPDYWFLYLISVQAPGVAVRELELMAYYDTGILVYVRDAGEPVSIDCNNIYGDWAAVFSAATKTPLKVTNNTLKAYPYLHPDFGGSFCYGAKRTEGATEISRNEMQCWSGVQIYPFNHVLDITDNTIDGGDGIWIGAWEVTVETGPEWGDNPPVRIVDNSIHLSMNPAYPEYSAGIMIGTSAHGISSTIVRGNTLTGEASYGGLVKQPYGHNNTFVNNDLTGLTTYSPQIWLLGGRDNHFQQNALGRVAEFSVGEWGPAFRDAATLVSTINWHRHDGLNTPDPVNHANHFNSNDYSQTGVTGWTSDESVGAVLLLDFKQKFFQPGWIPYEEPFDTENNVAEQDFPAGTDVCTQVLDLSNLQVDDLVRGTNTVAGWTACEAHARKDAYELVRERYRNFGQYLKEMMENRSRMMMFEKPPLE